MELAVEAPEILDIPVIKTILDSQTETTSEEKAETAEVPITIPVLPEISGPKVSAFSLASIRAKKEFQETTKAAAKEIVHLPTEAFTENDMLLQWNKYAQKLGDKGFKIMESLLLINDPVLKGTEITIELPNEGSKIDFELEKNALLGYLKGHLHNHDISIKVLVNESVENKFAFTAQDKFNRLNEINPTLDVLRKTFDLDL